MGTLTAGIKEIFSSEKTTGSNVMLCGNDGTPDGHMTMANLANVLGGANSVFIKKIDSKSVIGNGYVYIKIQSNGGFALKVLHAGSAHAGDGPVEVNIGLWNQNETARYKFVSGSGKVYHKYDGTYTHFIISPNTTIDYTLGIVLCNSLIVSSKTIDTRDSEYSDINSYTEGIAFT